MAKKEQNKVAVVAADIGNDTVKALFGGFDTTLEIPNIVSLDPLRQTVDLESDPLDGLHLEITSGALSNGKVTAAVGALASRYPQNNVLKYGDEKSVHDQPIIMLLTTLALFGVDYFEGENGVFEVPVHLGTGLPLAETKKGKRDEFRDKLLKNQHTVKFLVTPKHSGKVVHIQFKEVVVNSEGKAALIELVSNSKENLMKLPVLINDIGGLSTDSAIIINGEVDNVNSVGIEKGVSDYLDAIMQRVLDEKGYPFPNRPELVEVITDEGEDRNHVYVMGNRTSIQDIVDEELMKLARDEYNHIEALWRKVPKLRVCYCIGGGSVILRPYLEKLNKGFPLRFVGANESIWAIAKSYMKLILLHLQDQQALDTALLLQKQSISESAATTE